MKKRISPSLLKAFFSLLLFSGSLEAWAASSQFYTMSDRWEKRQSSAKENTQKEIVDAAFKSAMDESPLADTNAAIPRPQNLVLSMNQIEQKGNTVELELRQALLLGTSSPVVKYVTTQENVVYIEREEAQTLAIVASGIGATFVHIWDATGRRTFEIRVIPARYVPSVSQKRFFDELQKSRTFKVGYNFNRNDFYTGDKFRDTTRSSLNTTQRIFGHGDTPYGFTSAHVQMQKSEGSRNSVSDTRLSLADGRVGPFNNFNAAVGDSAVSPDLIVFPRARVRGVALEKWTEDESLKTTHFYGREQTSIIGTLTPSVLSKRSVDSFLSGNVVDWKASDKAEVKAGYFTGAGRARSDELNRRGMGASGRIGPYTNQELVYKPEVDYDNEHFAQRHEVDVKPWRNTSSSVQFRDINKNFQTLLGAPASQGELGYLWTAESQLWDSILFSSSVDIFRDRLIPNPEELSRYNKEVSLRASWVPWSRANSAVTYQRLDDRGRIGPTLQEVYGIQFSQGFDLWGRRSSFYTRYGRRDNEALTNALSSYNSHQWVTGFVTTIFWDINFTLQHEWNWLHEPNAAGEQDTEPRILTYTFDRNGRIYETPFYYNLRLEIRDEEESEASNSFLTGEDSARLGATLTYREIEDWEIYVDTTLAQYMRESNLSSRGSRAEVQFITGMRFLGDTGHRWEQAGNCEGYVFKDVNGDGLRSPEEPGIPKMKVQAFGGKTAVTDENGFYEIKGITGKKMSVALDSADFPYGYVPTNSIKQEKSYSQAQTVQIDFGLAPRSEVVGVVYNDLNGNGRYDVTDLGIRRVRITLDGTSATRTSGLGTYSFPKILAGAHTVKLDLSSLSQGYLPQILQKDIVVSEGIRFQLDFPVRASRSVTGQVYWDENGNETLDAGERPADGMTVRLGAQTSVTDAKGYYLFENVPAGTLKLAVDGLPAEWEAGEVESIALSQQPAVLSGKNIPLKKRPATEPSL